METKAIIKDGYTFDADLEGGRFYSPLSFKFRPLSVIERREWIDKEKKIEDDNSASKAKLHAELIVKHLAEWDAGEEITIENVLALPEELFDGAFLIVIGHLLPTCAERKAAVKARDDTAKASSDDVIKAICDFAAEMTVRSKATEDAGNKEAAELIKGAAKVALEHASIINQASSKLETLEKN